jgi:hypothetical protein
VKPVCCGPETCGWGAGLLSVREPAEASTLRLLDDVDVDVDVAERTKQRPGVTSFLA